MTRIAELEEEIFNLRKLLQKKEEELLKLKEIEWTQQSPSAKNLKESHRIPKWAIERYSRQCLVRELCPPLTALAALMGASTLIVGAGGLGCPAAGYLAGAGIGHIGIVDYDEVELSNIHRQLLHSETSIGMSKAESAALSLRRINSNITVTPYSIQLNSDNALDIIKQYDVILDCTDNVVTRYLLNDACVLAGKPLVTASALKLEGQLTIYNYTPKDSKSAGICMRCVFPTPPPPAAVGSCSQQGVLGPIPGVLGTLQALETIKLLLGAPTVAGTLILYDGTDCSFRTVKLRGKNPNCAVCSSTPSITALIDYPLFCNAQPSDKDLALEILSNEERLDPKEFYDDQYQSIKKKFNDLASGDCTRNIKIPKLSVDNLSVADCGGNTLLLDVRSEGEFDMCKIEGSINIPIEEIESKAEELAKYLHNSQVNEVYFLCRRGNDSQLAVRELKNKYSQLFSEDKAPVVRDIKGGLHRWAKDVDRDFPVY